MCLGRVLLIFVGFGVQRVLGATSKEQLGKNKKSGQGNSFVMQESGLEAESSTIQSLEPEWRKIPVLQRELKAAQAKARLSAVEIRVTITGASLSTIDEQNSFLLELATIKNALTTNLLPAEEQKRFDDILKKVQETHPALGFNESVVSKTAQALLTPEYEEAEEKHRARVRFEGSFKGGGQDLQLDTGVKLDAKKSTSEQGSSAQTGSQASLTPSSSSVSQSAAVTSVSSTSASGNG